MQIVIVVGGGLVGSEVVWQLVQQGVVVQLYEMCLVCFMDVYYIDKFVELVCSNFFWSVVFEVVVGLFKEEMCCLGLLVMIVVDKVCVFVGQVLVVDCDVFVQCIMEVLVSHLFVEV